MAATTTRACASAIKRWGDRIAHLCSYVGSNESGWVNGLPCARLAVLLLLFSLLGWLPSQNSGHNGAGRENGSSQLFSGSAAATREQEINAAIGVLANHAETLPPGPQRADLEAAVAGLKRMVKGRRFRLKKRGDLPGEHARAACEVEVRKPSGGGGMPDPAPPRDPAEDSWIDFPEEDWTQEPEEGGEPEDSGWTGGCSGQTAEDLAIVLWHEWCHASDGQIVALCPGLRRHICIVKGQINLAKSLETPPNSPGGEGPRNRRGLGHNWEEGSKDQLESLMDACKKAGCPGCGDCPETDPWRSQA